MPRLVFNGIILTKEEVPAKLAEHLHISSKKWDETQFSAVYVNSIAEMLNLEWRMPSNLDYLQISEI